MASGPEEDLSCPVCQDFFTDPVLLSCSHSFCRACLQSWWTQEKTPQCPCCKRRSSRSDPPRNLALKNLCEALVLDREQRAAAGSQHMCSLHAEKLKIFCLDHQEPVCVVCRDSRTHSDHTFRPVGEAAQDLRQQLQKDLRPLREKLQRFQQLRGECHRTATFIQVQARDTQDKIQQQFQKLHQILEREEKSRLEALREEEEQKSRMMKRKMEALSRDMAALSDAIRATEEQLRAGDVSLLRNHKTGTRRAEQDLLKTGTRRAEQDLLKTGTRRAEQDLLKAGTRRAEQDLLKAGTRRAEQDLLPEDPELPSGALIDVAQHLGNLTFNIWNKLRALVSYSPVVLDPNTADQELVVSDDLLSVTSGGSRELPRNPERTRFPCTVLGSQGLRSGTLTWTVDVGSNADWELGMLGAGVQAREQGMLGAGVQAREQGMLGAGVQAREQPQPHLWRISFVDGKLTALAGSGLEEDLQLEKVQRIKVHLDFDGGRLSFHDLESNTVIHTFRHCFTDALFPYIYTQSRDPLRIVPAGVSGRTPS